MSKIQVMNKRIVYPYVILHDIALYELGAAKGSEEGRFYNCLKAMVFSAFSLEAYIFHIGVNEESDWIKIEKRLNPKQKLVRLSTRKKFNSNFSSRPFMTFDQIFEFRKQIVHGKTQQLQLDEIRDGEIGYEPEILLAPWEQLINLDVAALFVEDSESMISILHPYFGYTTSPFFTQWKSSWEVKSAE